MRVIGRIRGVGKFWRLGLVSRVVVEDLEVNINKTKSINTLYNKKQNTSNV